MDRARARFARFARLLAVTAAALGLALTVGAAAPKEALAAPATISGQAYIHCTNPGQTNGDGNVFDVTISYSGHSFSGYTGYCQDHGLPYPADGWYPFTGTWTGSGYDILIDSRGATPHPECVFTSGPCQRVGGLDTLFNPLGDMDLLKKSSNPAVSDGNACYTLAGAVYSVYGSQADAQSGSNRLATLVTNSDGYAKATGLEMGAYYIKETTPAKGYALDGTVYPVQVEPAECAHVNGGTVYDTPQNDPAAMWVGKIDLDTTLNMPQGCASLAGAQYTVKYYAGYYDNEQSLPSQATRTWVVKTDEDGYAELADLYKVSGDQFYYLDGNVTIPLGTVTIQETKAPEGYLLGKQPLYIEKIVSTGNQVTSVAFNAPKDKEQVIKGGVKISKVDAETGDTPQGDASLAGIRFAIVNESANPVAVEGGTYANGQVVKVIETDASGAAATAADCLPYGSYSVHEVVSGAAGDGTALANGGYLLGGDAVTIDGVKMSSEKKAFDVKENGKVVDLTADQFANQVGRGGVSFHKLDRETNQPYPLGAGDLAAKFQIENASAHAVKVAGTVYQPGEVVYTGKASATTSGWKFATPKDLLPCGSYKLVETDPGEGYEKSTQEVAFTIDADDFGLVKDLSTLSDPAGATFANQVVRADVKLQKKDDTTGSKMAGVPFLIESVATGEKHVAVTDKNGVIDTSATRANSNAFDAALKDDGTIDNDKLVELVKRFGDKNSAEKQPTVWFGMNEKGLIADGRSYELDAQLMVVSADEDGEVSAAPYVDADGNEVKAVKEFTPDTAHGFVDVELSFNGLNLTDGQKLVCFETLKRAGAELAEHADAADEGQTVEVSLPKIGTTLTDAADGDKNIVSNNPVRLTDSVSYTGLVPGREYTVTGTLHMKAADGDCSEAVAVKDAEGNPVTAKAVFTPEKADGTVDVTFEFDGSELAHGDKIVAFESLDRKGVELAAHADIDDAAQTVSVSNPLIGTLAHDGLDGDSTVVADADASIVDDVTYRNLAKGSKYTLVAMVMDKETALPLYTGDEAGEIATDTVSGQIESFYVDVLKAMGTDADSLDAYAKAMAAHKDGEALPVLKVGTVDYEALQKALADRTKLASQLVMKQADFTADGADGVKSVTLDFDASKWLKADAPADCTVFEFLLHEGKLVAAHADIDDKGQSFEIAPSECRTMLTDETDGDHVILPSTTTSLIDTVAYENLIPGKEYKVSGKLMLKDTDKPLYVGDKAVTAEKTFTPNQPSGTVELRFEFDSSSLDGKEIVAFEKLTKDDVEVAVHEDIDDQNQTVTVDKLNGAKGKTYSKTGVSLSNYAWLGWMLLIAAIGTFCAGEAAHRREMKRAAACAKDAE